MCWPARHIMMGTVTRCIQSGPTYNWKYNGKWIQLTQKHKKLTASDQRGAFSDTAEVNFSIFRCLLKFYAF